MARVALLVVVETAYTDTAGVERALLRALHDRLDGRSMAFRVFTDDPSFRRGALRRGQTFELVEQIDYHADDAPGTQQVGRPIVDAAEQMEPVDAPPRFGRAAVGLDDRLDGRVCPDCGVLAVDRRLHEAFHRRIDRIDQDSRLDGRR